MTNPQTNVLGLSESEAQSRLREHGYNRLHSPVQISALSVFLGQFRNILIIILLAATGFSAVIGHEAEALAIAIIVLFSVIFGFIQEYRAEHALHALQKLTAPTANVVRDGAEQQIRAEMVVPGDVLVLAAEALRVIAVATKHVADTLDIETGYTLLGFIGIIDPPRDAPAFTVYCRSASLHQSCNRWFACAVSCRRPA